MVRVALQIGAFTTETPTPLRANQIQLVRVIIELYRQALQDSHEFTSASRLYLLLSMNYQPEYQRPLSDTEMHSSGVE